MGLGKIASGLGKVGLAFEALGYVIKASKKLGGEILRSKSAEKEINESGASNNGEGAPNQPIERS